MYGEGEALTARLDEVVLHELLHNELRQFGEDPTHKGEAWARRCQEISDRLGLTVHIERPRSIRRDGRVTTGSRPAACPMTSWRAGRRTCWPMGRR